MKNTHNSQLLAALKAGESITPIDALNRWGCFRLSGRIHDLRHGTYDGVKHDIENVGGKFAEYRLKAV